ncbi:hypothetical protein [Tenacibaculum piscium]|uniref:hypothetical protein n=1 Tax=Tenacibaculum piscium TaxID=1458515 RepID=UPI001F23A46F|nr:hypothetical protein [Tenacibaculum piscium]
MPSTQKQLADKLFEIREEYSNNPTIKPEVARKEMALKEAKAINDFVIGRTTTVTGASATGGPITGTGIIK